MKILLSIVLFITINSVFAQETISKTWYLNIDTAKVEAKKTNKPIMIVFSGSDWCKPCMKLKHEILESETFLNFAKDSLVLVAADFPRLKTNKQDDAQVKHNEKLASKFNNDGSFPKVTIINADEKILGTLGYKAISPREYINEC
jgi:thioredoxin-related protein